MLRQIAILMVLIASVSSMPLFAQPDPDLAIFLSFDDGKGDIAADSSPNGLNAQINGPQWVAGKFGSALEFDGVDDIVVIGDAPELLLLDGGTIMAWVLIKTDAGHASWPRVCLKSNTNGGTGPGYDFLFDRGLNYSLRFCTGGACNTYGEPVETDAWHHVAVTFDGSNVRTYVDGSLTDEGPQNGPVGDSTGLDLSVGNSLVAARQFNGIMDEFRIWTRALEEDEIRFQMEHSADDIFAVDAAGKLATRWAQIKL